VNLLRTVAAGIGLLSTGAALGLLLSGPAADTAYKLGVKQGQKQVSMKQLITEDPKLTRTVCNAWWFDYDHRDRRLK
jgi:hypothetical protein